MRKFLLALLIPCLIVAALNWRTLAALALVWLRPSLPVPAAAVVPAELPDNTLAIPALRLTAPIVPSLTDPTSVSDWRLIRQSLTQGVSLAQKLAPPGEGGTTVITGHSSDWTPHRYAAVFAALSSLEPGERITLQYGGKRYFYSVVEKQVVAPADTAYFNQLKQKTPVNRLALVTCTPLFSTAKRLVVIAEPVP